MSLLDPDAWNHRRRMAYMSFGGLLILAIAVLLGKVDPAGADLGAALAYAFASIIIAYIGGVVVDDVKARLAAKTA